MKYALCFVAGYLVAASTCFPKVEEKNESHPYCYDTSKYNAWVAYKGTDMRCFMEQKQYPHRVTASHISKDDYAIDE